MVLLVVPSCHDYMIPKLHIAYENVVNNTNTNTDYYSNNRLRRILDTSAAVYTHDGRAANSPRLFARRRAANFSSAIRTIVVQLILFVYSHDRRDFHSQSCRSFLQHVAR